MIQYKHHYTTLNGQSSLPRLSQLLASQSRTKVSPSMANQDLTSPLLSRSLSDHHEVTITVESDSDIHNHDQPCNSHSPNPYEFLGVTALSVPVSSTVDPFRNGTPTVEGFYEALKIVVSLPIVLVRLVVFGLCLVVGYAVTKLAMIGCEDNQNPIPKWRCRIMWLTRLCARVILFSFGYHWIKRKGKPAPREIAPIIVSNHVSYIEPIFYFYEISPTIVTSESHDSIPIVGTIIRAMQVIYVSRFSKSSRKQAVNEIKRKASCNDFPPVLLFPEGTTTNGKGLISFQLGAFLPGYPIQPVVVRYPHVHFDQSWGHISLVKLVLRMFTQFHNFMEVEYLPIVYPPDNKKESTLHLAERTRHAIATSLNVIQTSHSYGDLMLLTKASQLQLVKPARYMVEMAKVESLFHLSNSEAVIFLEKFASMNPDHRGRVIPTEFFKVLRLKACTLSEEMFRFLDVDNSGSITFKQFIFGSAQVMSHQLFQQACEIAFSECDVDGDGYISPKQLRTTIGHLMLDMNNEVDELFVSIDIQYGGRVITRESFFSCLRQNPLLIALFSPARLNCDTSSD